MNELTFKEAMRKADLYASEGEHGYADIYLQLACSLRENEENRAKFEEWKRSIGETPSAFYFMEDNRCYVDSSIQSQYIAFCAGLNLRNKHSGTGPRISDCPKCGNFREYHHECPTKHSVNDAQDLSNPNFRPPQTEAAMQALHPSKMSGDKKYPAPWIVAGLCSECGGMDYDGYHYMTCSKSIKTSGDKCPRCGWFHHIEDCPHDLPSRHSLPIDGICNGVREYGHETIPPLSLPEVYSSKASVEQCPARKPDGHAWDTSVSGDRRCCACGASSER